jgi:TatD DNase family protein
MEIDNFIDTHAHLDFPQFHGDLDQVLERARQAGVGPIINVGTTEQSSHEVVALSARYSQLWASVGVHPHYAEKVSPRGLDQLESLAENSKVLAIGETGLDFYRRLSAPDIQEQLFRKHVQMACRINKPLIIHSRSANVETLRVLRDESLPGRRGVMHCFSGDLQELQSFLRLGFYISVAGPVTYPKSHALRDLLKVIPRERLLLETDCPYLPPQAFRGLRNEPAFIKSTYERVALVLRTEPEVLAIQIQDNANCLFPELSTKHI